MCLATYNFDVDVATTTTGFNLLAMCPVRLIHEIYTDSMDDQDKAWRIRERVEPWFNHGWERFQRGEQMF